MPFISLKKLGSRSRSNSTSYVEGPEYRDHPEPKTLYDDGYGSTSTHHDQHDQRDYDAHDPGFSHSNGYSSRDQSRAKQSASYGNGTSASAATAARPSMSVETPTSSNMPKSPVGSAAPVDLFTQAFNTAVTPYTSRIEALEDQVAQLQLALDDARAALQDADHRQDLFYSWIDKRGMRMDMPVEFQEYVSQRDSQAGSPLAAEMLYNQFARKINIINYDLHRVQDDLNHMMPVVSFAECIVAFLGPIDKQLTKLPGGPERASRLLCQLTTSLISHAISQSEDSRDEVTLNKDSIRYLDMVDAALYPLVELSLDNQESWPKFRKMFRASKKSGGKSMPSVEAHLPRTKTLLDRADAHAGANDLASPPILGHDDEREDSPRRAAQYGNH